MAPTELVIRRCSLPGCDVILERKARGRPAKYCCREHSKVMYDRARVAQRRAARARPKSSLIV